MSARSSTVQSPGIAIVKGTPKLTGDELGDQRVQTIDGGAPVPRELAPSGDKRLLDGVLGEAEIAQRPLGDGIQPIGPRSRQDGERFPVSAACLLHEVAIHPCSPF